MEAFMFYLGKMILCSGVMFAYYLLFLKDKTFHHYNRFYLLLTVIISLVLPLIKVSYFTIETNQNFYLLLSQLNQNQLQNSTNDLTIYQVFYAIIGVVSIALLIRLILGITRIQSIKNQFPNETIEGIKFYQTNLNNAPFSYFRNLFWKQSIQLDSPVGQQILKHEMVHIQQKHSWDKLMMQTVKSVFWFNPVFYFINKEINLIHEYLADKKAVKKSDTRAFAQMLLESHFSGSVIPVTSPFLSSNLKKRLKMLTKNQTKCSYARKLFALPILFFMVFAYMVNAKNKEITETNKAIEIAVNELKNDTIKSGTDSMGHNVKVVDSPKEIDVLDTARKATDNALFIVEGKEVSKNEFLKYVEKNQKNKDFTLSYSTADMQSDNEHLVYGEKEKLGVFSADNISDLTKNAKKYHQIIKKYNPKWYNDKILNNKYGKIEAEKQIEKAVARVNSPEFKKRIADAEKSAEEAVTRVNSPEFKKRIADAEKRAEEAVARVNSQEFRIRIANAEKLAQTSADNIGKIYSEADFSKMITDQFGKDAFTDGTVRYGRIPSEQELKIMRDLPTNFSYSFSDEVFFNTDKSTLSPKEIKKLEKKRKELRKKQLELQEEQKKLQLKQRELNKQAGQNSPWIISVDAKAKPAVNNVSYVGVATYTEDSPKANYYLNGTKISSEDFKNINSKDIRTVDVLKENKVSTIKIVTK